MHPEISLKDAGIRKALFVLIVLLPGLLAVACSQNNNSRTIETLNVAVLPDQNESQLRARYLPLLEHIRKKTGLSGTLKIPASYQQLLAWFDNRQVDLALFGGATYIKAHLQSGAVPLVMRDVDARFRSVVLVQAKNPATTLQALKGASFAFGSPLSTSGHFMPRHFLQQHNINAETFFGTTQFSGAHDRTVEWVRDGKVDAGVVNSVIVSQMFLDGRLTHKQVKIIWASPFYADYVWAVQADISTQQISGIRDAFLLMNQVEEDKQLLQKLGANYYIPAGDADFNNLKQIVQQTEQQMLAP